MTDDTHWVGSRQLLRRLRDAMARGGNAHERLDRIAQLIARGMVAEVCSVYVMRGETLVLYSTEGLRKDAVFRTRLQVGEGLVGNIASNASPLALADAQSHPQFAYRPETGEEIYHSFLGVPVVRSGRVLGVLTVQNQTQRNYTEEEIETLETVAMVVAEHIAGGDLRLPDEAKGMASSEPVRLEGTKINPGLASGVAVLHERGAPITQTIAEGGTLSLGGSPLLGLANSGLLRVGSDALVPYPLLIFLAVIGAATYALHFTVFGRYVYAIGGNRDAAEYSGINVKRVETSTYVISAGLGGGSGRATKKRQRRLAGSVPR